jgi:NAD+ kinase
MKRIGLIANHQKPRAEDVLRRIGVKSAELGLDVCSKKETAAIVEAISEASIDEMLDSVDAVMALGGDGTMLRAVRALGGRDIPLIGVNIGSLGFMTSVAEEDLERAMDCLAADEIEFSHRTVAESIVVKDGKEANRYRALNDVVVSSGASNRVVTLDVSIDGEAVTSYVCDGLIVSTPTGSTGHNLSAGGPIVIPDTRAFVISLICPHTLSSRPLVVPDTGEIIIRGEDLSDSGLLLSVDGQVSQTLSGEEYIKVRAGTPGVRFIHLPGYHYFTVMSQKLGWKGSSGR